MVPSKILKSSSFFGNLKYEKPKATTDEDRITPISVSTVTYTVFHKYCPKLFSVNNL